MKKTVEEKAELAKLKIDKKLQKQQKKAEKVAAKKEASAAKKEAKKEVASAKKEAKKEAKALKKKAEKEAAEKIKALKNDVTKAKASPKSDTKSDLEKEDVTEKTSAKGKKAKKEKGKGKKDKQEGGKSKKKLFIAALALVFVSGGVVGFLHFRGGEKEESKDPYIEAYVLDDDFVTSIPKFLGESEQRDLPEITEETNGESKKIIYDYTNLNNGAKEVKDYVNYLIDEKEFVYMFDYNLDAPAGYVSVATASQEEGKILKLDIDYTNTDYKVMVSKTSEKLPPPKQKSDGADISRDGALTFLSGFSSEDLGLDKPVEEYKAIYDNGQSSINNNTCYGISLYDIGKAGTNVFAGKYFIATNQSDVFRYNPEKDTYVEIGVPEKKMVEDALAEQQSNDGENETSNDNENDDTDNEQQKASDDEKDTDNEEDKTSDDKKDTDDEEDKTSDDKKDIDDEEDKTSDDKKDTDDEEDKKPNKNTKSSNNKRSAEKEQNEEQDSKIKKEKS